MITEKELFCLYSITKQIISYCKNLLNEKINKFHYFHEIFEIGSFLLIFIHELKKKILYRKK